MVEIMVLKSLLPQWGKRSYHDRQEMFWKKADKMVDGLLKQRAQETTNAPNHGHRTFEIFNVDMMYCREARFLLHGAKERMDELKDDPHNIARVVTEKFAVAVPEFQEKESETGTVTPHSSICSSMAAVLAGPDYRNVLAELAPESYIKAMTALIATSPRGKRLEIIEMLERGNHPFRALARDPQHREAFADFFLGAVTRMDYPKNVDLIADIGKNSEIMLELLGKSQFADRLRAPDDDVSKTLYVAALMRLTKESKTNLDQDEPPVAEP